MKHSCLVNGYDNLNLTKLDVLDGFEEIKVGTKYLVDGKALESFPGTWHGPARETRVSLLESGSGSTCNGFS